MSEINYEVLKEPEVPRIFVTPEAMHKMRYYIDHCDTEIGWLGYVQKRENNYLIEDVFLVKQKVHAATTELDAGALADLATELINQGAEGIAKYNSIRMWGHSHVNMEPTPSGQDNKQMDEFATTDFYIRLIGNKKGSWNVSLWDYSSNILWTGLSLEYYFDIDIDNTLLDNDIKDKVSKIETVSTKSNNYENFFNKSKRGYPYYDGYYNDYPFYDDDWDYMEGYYKKKKEEQEEQEEQEAGEINIDSDVIPYIIHTGFLSEKNIIDILSYYDTYDELLLLETGDIESVKDMLFEDGWGCEFVYPYYFKNLALKAGEEKNKRYKLVGGEIKDINGGENNG